MFILLEVDEMVDGRIWCKWETVADDGLRLVEGDYFIPDSGESIEDCVRRSVSERKIKRNAINAQPKVRQRVRPARKRGSATLSKENKNMLIAEINNTISPISEETNGT